MKFYFLSLFVLVSQIAMASERYYLLKNGEQLGNILLSLGNGPIWGEEGKSNLFKNKLNIILTEIPSGTLITFEEEDILFKKNVHVFKDNFIRIKKLISTKEEFNRLAAEESMVADELPENVKLENTQVQAIPPVREIKATKTIYFGAGGFIASNQENKNNTKTTTFSGIQPLLQLKGIYSNEQFGSAAFDGMLKKIITDQYSFPFNADYRFQYVPKWNFQSAKIAFSHSSIKHSYVGKLGVESKVFNLHSKFLGVGLIVPRENYWLEIYLEKSISGKLKSQNGSETRHASAGYSINTEIVYPLSKYWSLLPGLNFYQLRGEDYDFKVFEGRLIIARELNL